MTAIEPTTTSRDTTKSIARCYAEDTGTITRRNITRLARQPDSIVFGVIQSVLFVLLFRYVFGGPSTCPAATTRSS